MREKSNLYGPALDDELSRETEGMTRGTGSTHAEEWKEPEPTEAVPMDGREPGSPPGMTSGEVDSRSEVAKALAPVKFPADRARIIERFEQAGRVPDDVLDVARQLPHDRTFHGVMDVLRALGIHSEEHRF
jgi:hypothetical protein